MLTCTKQHTVKSKPVDIPICKNIYMYLCMHSVYCQIHIYATTDYIKIWHASRSCIYIYIYIWIYNKQNVYVFVCDLYLPTYSYAYPSTHPFNHQISICIINHPPIYLFICLSVYLSVCLSVCPSVCLYRPICISISLSASLHANLSHLSVYLFILFSA